MNAGDGSLETEGLKGLAEDVIWGGREQILSDREFIQELDRSGYRFQLLRFEEFQLFDFQEPLMLHHLPDDLKRKGLAEIR